MTDFLIVCVANSSAATSFGFFFHWLPIKIEHIENAWIKRQKKGIIVRENNGTWLSRQLWLKYREKEGEERCVCVHVTWFCTCHMIVRVSHDHVPTYAQSNKNTYQLCNDHTIFYSGILCTFSFDHNVLPNLAGKQNYPIRSICLLECEDNLIDAVWNGHMAVVMLS